MPKPRFIVGMAAYNGMEWIEEQVESILNQVGVEVVLVVSVDESDDGTEAMIRELSILDERVVVLPPAGRFGNAGLNFFHVVREIWSRDFEYFAFADQDDFWFPDKLMRAFRVLRSENADGYSSNVLAFWPDGKELFVRKSQPQRDWDFLFEAAGPGCTYVLSKRLFLDFQGLIRDKKMEVDKIAVHDWLCYAFARSVGYAWIIDEIPSMRYRQHSVNQSGVNVGLRAKAVRFRRVGSGVARRQSKNIAYVLGLQDYNLVKALSSGWLGNLYLASKASQCRRRFRDRVIFSMLCLFNIF